jgi:hypothetical protein
LFQASIKRAGVASKLMLAQDAQEPADDGAENSSVNGTHGCAFLGDFTDISYFGADFL